MSEVPNVLASRYASAEMRGIWSAQGRIRTERQFWIAVMKGQQSLGLDIPEEAIKAYEKVIDQIDLEAIDARERVTRHDVKARIEAFNELAGYEHIHKGLTSRDLTENVEQMLVHASLKLVRYKVAAALAKLGEAAGKWSAVPITGRTHNVAAQLTTFGKRLAMFGEELIFALDDLERLLEAYPARGLKGAVGTQLDQIRLFDGQTEKARELEKRVLEHLGISHSWSAVGQVYPRSLDFRTVSALVMVGAPISSFAKTLRLMAGHELASEGFAKGQVGSSAMPHKMNSRSCERINGFHVLLKGYESMAGALAGDQWNEGDVSCSVVRRVVLPDSFFAIDGMLETFITILQQMGLAEGVVQRENSHYLPFLMTTAILMEAVKQGAGREAAHEAIKEHAVAVIAQLRSDPDARNDLVSRLGNDDRLPLGQKKIEEILATGEEGLGAAREQCEAFAEKCRTLAKAYPGSADYEPAPIL